MNKSILPYIIIALFIGIVIAYYMDKQNRKINGLAYGLSVLQNGVAQSQMAAQVALQEIHELKDKAKLKEEQLKHDHIWGSEPDPIAISTAD